MKRTITILTLALMCVVFVSCIKGNDDSPPEVINRVKVNDPLPEFEVRGKDGLTLKTDDFNGRKSLLLLFTTGCSDCRRVLPTVEKVWNDLKNDPRYMVAAIARQQNAVEITAFWTDNKYTMPWYIDPDRSVYEKFANSIVPRIYIVNTEGVVKWMTIEKLDLTATKLIDILKKVD